MRYYTGVGSRETPDDICELMFNTAQNLASAGFTLRSGHADKADLAFERGANGKSDIYLPWASFNKEHPVLGRAIVPPYTIQSEDIAMRFCPHWNNCTNTHKRMHNRNGYQVLGDDLQTPSEFEICWTPKGKGGGGTGQAIRIAKAYNIPVFDLGSPDGIDRLIEYGNTL